MLKGSNRYVLRTGKVSIIRDVLSLVLAEVKSEGDVAPGTYQSLEGFVRDGCDRMILELRRPGESSPGVSPRIRNLRASHIGRVLVVSGEVTAAQILHEIETLARPHFFPKHVISGLLAFVRTLF